MASKGTGLAIGWMGLVAMLALLPAAPALAAREGKAASASASADFLVPLEIKALPTEPLTEAYPNDSPQSGYQAQFSPDKTLLALGVEDDAGYVKQVWLYQPASGRLVVASPLTHPGKKEKPEHIAELRPWVWGGDGRLYLRARRPLGKDMLIGADRADYAEADPPPPDVARKFAEFDAARPAARQDGAAEPPPPPGFDDDSYDEQEGGGFLAWAQNKGHGSFDLLAAREGDPEPRLIASGGWELRDYLFDPGGRRLLYNGEDGIVATDPDTGTTRRVQGLRGTPREIRLINLSADGGILVYARRGACGRVAADEAGTRADDDGRWRVCLAYLPADAGAGAGPRSGQENAPGDPWLGTWVGSRNAGLSASIRRGSAKPEYLVVNLTTAAPGCAGAVTLYGKPEGASLSGASYDPGDPRAPVCLVDFTLDGSGALTTEVAGPCSYYHGGACDFEGALKRAP